MSDEREERHKCVAALRALKVDPFGQRFDGAQPAGEIVARFGELENKPACVAGRVTALRSMGKAAFLDVRDWSGKIQVHAKKDKLGESWPVFENVHIGDLVAFGGPLGKTKTGEITIFAESFTFLTKALRPLPEKFHGLSDPEIRYRQRYLDLISNPEVLQKFLKRAKVISLMRRFLDERGYVEVETPMMHSIPGGAAARPFKTHHNALGRDLFLRIALEIPLKKLLVGGIEKVYEIGRVFRNEGVDTQHNPEFTLLELYVAREGRGRVHEGPLRRKDDRSGLALAPEGLLGADSRARGDRRERSGGLPAQARRKARPLRGPEQVRAPGRGLQPVCPADAPERLLHRQPAHRDDPALPRAARPARLRRPLRDAFQSCHFVVIQIVSRFYHLSCMVSLPAAG